MEQEGIRQEGSLQGSVPQDGLPQDGILIEVLTPEGQALSERAASFTLNTALGRMGVMKGHAPLAALVESGPLIWHNQQGGHRLELGRGFLELEGDRAVILVEQARPVADPGLDR